MTNNDQVAGLIDWGCAGFGHPGIDLGHLRLSVAFEHGMSATVEVLMGWQQETGRPSEAMAYWDIIAALNTPADMGGLPRLATHSSPTHYNASPTYRESSTEIPVIAQMPTIHGGHKQMTRRERLSTLGGERSDRQ